MFKIIAVVTIIMTNGVEHKSEPRVLPGVAPTESICNASLPEIESQMLDEYSDLRSDEKFKSSIRKVKDVKITLKCEPVEQKS